jgi:hypothetical protein
MIRCPNSRFEGASGAAAARRLGRLRRLRLRLRLRLGLRRLRLGRLRLGRLRLRLGLGLRRLRLGRLRLGRRLRLRGWVGRYLAGFRCQPSGCR